MLMLPKPWVAASISTKRSRKRRRIVWPFFPSPSLSYKVSADQFTNGLL